MAELDQQTRQWLKSLKINKTLTSLADFENGYNFGTIFDKLQLTKGKKFKNSSDLACVFQNYKNVRDILLETFNYDFPVNNIIYRTADLLKVVMQQGNKYLEQKKILSLKAATSIGSFDKSLIQPQQQKQFKTRQKQINASSTVFHQTSKLPKKIQDIEKKLDKFRQQKTRHELVALEQRKQQIQQYRRVVMNNRDYEINKTRKNHEQGREKQRKVYDVWYKTELIKKSRIETDKNFDLFQQQKRNKLLDSIRKDDIDTINKGMEMFQLNCMRQGIQLQHDPDKPLKPEGQFNKIVVLERIKDNIQKHEIDKKQRIKRENKKKLDAQEAKIQSEALWGELNKIEDLAKKLSSHFSLCQNTYKIQKRFEGEYQTRKQKCKDKTFVDLPAYEDEQKRESQFRKRKVEYLYNDVKYIQSKWNKQFSISEQIVEALLQVAIEGEEKFNKNGGFLYSQWKQIEERFLNFQDSRKNKSKDTKLYVDYSNFNKLFDQYLKANGSWRNFYSFEPQNLQSQLLKNLVATIIAQSYPDLAVSSTEKLPLDMPLKVIFHGPRLSGKSSHCAKIAQKYGIVIINPKQIIKQSLELAKPPVEQDNKKGAKKQTKKVEQLTSEKIALKQFGLKLSERINSLEESKIQEYIQAVKFKILQSFKLKTQQQIRAQYTAAKQKQKSRHQQALKDFQEAQKKPKKDSKKGGETVAQDPPKPNTCFYSLGFVIDDLPLSQQNLKILQRQLNGFISDEEKTNAEGVKAKQMISSVLSIPEPPKDERLKAGIFDLLISLQIDEQNALKRKSGRKIDPQTKIIYHPSFNPIPEVKGFAEKLLQLPSPDDQMIKSSLGIFEDQKQKIRKFYSVFGFEQGKVAANTIIAEKDEGVNQTFEQINKKIENLLQEKYISIETMIAKSGAESSQDLNVENKSADQNPSQNQNFENFLANNLNQQESKSIIQKYVTDVKKYEQSVKQSLFELDKERDLFLKELLTVQKNFTNIINRPDDKAGKILAFQQNYNKLLQQKGNIVKDAQASRHLIHRLNQLYDSLWSAIESKKNESVESRIQFKQSDWLNIQCSRIVEIAKKLLQAELNYLCETIFTILIVSCKAQKKSSDYLTEYLALGIASQLEPIETISKDSGNLVQNKRIDYYINQTNKCLQSLPAWIEQKYKKMKIEKLAGIDQLLSQFVNLGVENIRRRQSNIRNKCNQRILEQRSYYQVLLNKMDDWVIQGIKAENDFVYQIYKNIKKSIEEVKKSNVKELYAKQITQFLYPIRDLSLNPFPLRLQTIYNKIPIYSYTIFLQQIKTLANNEGKINFQIFKKYMDKRRKSQLLHPIILRINYDTVEQFLVKDGYLYFKQLALAVIFWHINVFDDDQLTLYKSKLLKQEITSQQRSYKAKASNSQSEENSPEKSISLNSSGKKRGSAISAFPTQKRIKFDELILIQGTFDQQEQLIFRHFIFEIFRENGSDYIEAQSYLDTLSLFDQIQVLKYGNTVMMLDI